MVARSWTMCWLVIAACLLVTLLTAVNTAAEKTAERSETEEFLQLLKRLQVDLEERENPGHRDEIDGHSRATGKNNRNSLGHTLVDGERTGELGRDTGVDEEHLLMGRIEKLDKSGVASGRSDTGTRDDRHFGVDRGRSGALDREVNRGSSGALDGEQIGKLGRDTLIDDKFLLTEGRQTKAVGRSSDPAGPILRLVMELLVALLDDSLNLTLSHVPKSNEVVERRKREAADDHDSSAASSPSGNPLVHRMLQEIGQLNYYLVAYDVLSMYPPPQQQQQQQKASRSAAETVLGKLGMTRIQLGDAAPVDDN